MENVVSANELKSKGISRLDEITASERREQRPKDEHLDRVAREKRHHTNREDSLGDQPGEQQHAGDVDADGPRSERQPAEQSARLTMCRSRVIGDRTHSERSNQESQQIAAGWPEQDGVPPVPPANTGTPVAPFAK